MSTPMTNKKQERGPLPMEGATSLSHAPKRKRGRPSKDLLQFTLQVPRAVILELDKKAKEQGICRETLLRRIIKDVVMQ